MQQVTSGRKNMRIDSRSRSTEMSCFSSPDSQRAATRYSVLFMEQGKPFPAAVQLHASLEVWAACFPRVGSWKRKWVCGGPITSLQVIPTWHDPFC